MAGAAGAWARAAPTQPSARTRETKSGIARLMTTSLKRTVSCCERPSPASSHHVEDHAQEQEQEEEVRGVEVGQREPPVPRPARELHVSGQEEAPAEHDAQDEVDPAEHAQREGQDARGEQAARVQEDAP